MYGCSFEVAIGLCLCFCVHMCVFVLLSIILIPVQYDPETSHESVRYRGPPKVMFAYLEYQWSLGEDLKRKEAFARLQVYLICQFASSR